MRSYILVARPFAKNDKWTVKSMLEDEPYKVFTQFKKLHDESLDKIMNKTVRLDKKICIYCQIDEDNNGQLSYTEIIGDMVQTMVLNEINLYNIFDFDRDEYKSVCEMMHAVMDYKISHRI